MDTETFAVNWRQIVFFVTSWGFFLLVGRIFFENVLGQYHSSHLRKWVSVCKALFLAVFCLACTLLELVCFEIMDLLHPTIRQFMWTASLALLCILLNVMLPGVFAASVSVHLDLPWVVSIVIGVANVIVFQAMMWFLARCLPIYEDSSAAKHLFAPVMMHRYDYSAESIISYFGSYLSLDIQTSVAVIAVVGTSTAAVIAGFATVQFPLQQLMIPQGLDMNLLRAREDYLNRIMESIANRKKVFYVLQSKYFTIRGLHNQVNDMSPYHVTTVGTPEPTSHMLLSQQPSDFGPSTKDVTATLGGAMSLPSTASIDKNDNSRSQWTPLKSKILTLDAAAAFVSPTKSESVGQPAARRGENKYASVLDSMPSPSPSPPVPIYFAPHECAYPLYTLPESTPLPPLMAPFHPLDVAEKMDRSLGTPNPSCHTPLKQATLPAVNRSLSGPFGATVKVQCGDEVEDQGRIVSDQPTKPQLGSTSSSCSGAVSSPGSAAMNKKTKNLRIAASGSHLQQSLGFTLSYELTPICSPVATPLSSSFASLPSSSCSSVAEVAEDGSMYAMAMNPERTQRMRLRGHSSGGSSSSGEASGGVGPEASTTSSLSGSVGGGDCITAMKQLQHQIQQQVMAKSTVAQNTSLSHRRLATPHKLRTSPCTDTPPRIWSTAGVGGVLVGGMGVPRAGRVGGPGTMDRSPERHHRIAGYKICGMACPGTVKGCWRRSKQALYSAYSDSVVFASGLLSDASASGGSGSGSGGRRPCPDAMREQMRETWWGRTIKRRGLAALEWTRGTSSSAGAWAMSICGRLRGAWRRCTISRCAFS